MRSGAGGRATRRVGGNREIIMYSRLLQITRGRLGGGGCRGEQKFVVVSTLDTRKRLK